MKKKFALLLSIMLCLFCLPSAAFAAEADEMVPVVVKTPDGWDAPCLWAWADDGTNAFAAWPGEELEPLEGGWYYAYVPSFVQNVIVNANNDTDAPVQTEGIVVEAGKEVWLTIGEDAAAEVAYESQARIEIPEYVEKFVVHAYVPLDWKTANLWAWSAPDGTNAFDAWPGLALKEGGDGWFTGKAPVWVNSIIVNGNEGTVQTEDVSVEGKELWITVYEDLSYDLAYEDPNKTAEDITVRAQVPADWAGPCLWAWSAPDGTNAFASWPGEALTQDGDWYTIQAPGWINSVIINGNEGSVQTSDLSVEPGKDIWVVVNGPDDAVVSYEEPAGEPAQADPTETEPVTSEEPAPAAEPEPAGNNNTGLIVGGVAAAVVVVGGGAALAVSKKKKK
ncbi:MAG: starch-binding protein [Clostridiales bacterium]|nr:starch-binding protein [Clostridiales bacterium]